VEHQIHLKAVIGDPEWTSGKKSPLFRTEVSGTEPETTALKAFEELKQVMKNTRDYTIRPRTRRLILTRSKEGNLDLMDRFKLLSVEFVDYPVLQFSPCGDEKQINTVIETISSFNWILFTSKTAVRFFAEHVPPYIIPHRVSIGSIGPGTAATLEQEGYRVNYIASISTSEGLLDEFVSRFPSRLGKILIPGPEKGQDKLYRGLIERDAHVEKMVLYRTETLPPEELPHLTMRPDDILLFLSPSAVSGFISQNRILKDNVVFSMGPVTTTALKDADVQGLIIEPEQSNLDSLVLTVKEYMMRQKSGSSE
jgi:uroporphyrinogen-III synthase